MPLYDYSGLDAQGKKVKGVVEASSVEEILNKLRSENIHVLDVAEVKKESGRGGGGGKIKSEDLVIFSRQLSSLISAGIPIVKSLGILAEQTENKAFKNIILSIQKSIGSGNSLADSFAKYPKLFSPLFINMVNVGEFSGSLDVMLERLANYLKSYNDLIKRVQSALVYPIGIIIVATLIMIALFVFVIPGFEKMFSGLGGQMPLPTQILILISKIIKKYFLVAIVVVVAFFLGLRKYISTPRGSEQWEKLTSKMPLIGKLFLKMVLARFVKTLAILVRSGVPILNSLLVAGKTSGSRILEAKMETIKDDVSRGNKLADSLKKSEFFPIMLVSMVGVGEESGDLPAMLEKIAEMYEGDVDAAVSGLLSLLEPAIMVFLGVVVGGIVVCLFMPILKIPQMVAAQQ
ncbi:MAG: type II secretion system F family protein [Candidatus Omnitrophota bacterium]|jgi:type IV pilus assembly protein PilC